MAVAFVVLAAVPAVSESSAADATKGESPLGDLTGATYSDGVYTLSQDVTITLKKDVTLEDVKFVGNYKLTITSASGKHYGMDVNYDFGVSDFTSATGNIFQVKDLLLKNADLSIVQEDTGKDEGPASNAQGCSVFGTANVTVEGKSNLSVSADEFANRIFYNNNSSLTISGSEAKVVLNGTTSSTVSLSMSDGAALEINNPRFTAGNFYPNVSNTGAPCMITVTGAGSGNHGLFFYGGIRSGSTDAGELKNCVIKSDGIVGFYSHNSVDATGSTIEAKKLVVARSSAANEASVSGVTLKVDEIAQTINPNDGYKTETGKSMNLFGVLFTGATKITNGASIKFVNDSFVATGASITVEKGATVSVEDCNLYNGGTVTGWDGAKSAQEVTDASVSDESQLEMYLQAGAKTITYTGTTISSDTIVGAATELKLNADIIVAKGITLDVQGKITGDKTITLTNDAKAPAKINVEGTLSATIAGNGATAVLSGVGGTYAIAPGSVYVNGVLATGDITVSTGDVFITGTITDTLTITGNGGNVYLGSKDAALSVASNAKLTLKGTDEVIKVGGSLLIYGTLTSSIADGDYNLKADVYDVGAEKIKPSVKAYNGASIYKVLISGDGSIDLSQAQGPQTVGEDISADKIYGQLENVTIIGSLTIKNNAVVTVRGGFQVNEGVTLTIEKGSKLLIDSSAASMIVNGRIIVENGARLYVNDANDMQVSGSIESEGELNIRSNVTVKSGGSIFINDEYGSTITATKDFTIESGASLVIKASVGNETNVYNKGTVTLDGAVLNAQFNVHMLADSAVVQILDVRTENSAKSIVVNDLGLEFPDKTKVDDAGVASNAVTIDVGVYQIVKGLTIVEKVSSYVYEGTTYYTNTMDVAGSVSVASIEDVPSASPISTTVNVIKVSGDRIAVAGELDLGKNVGFIVNGKISVSGKLIATEERSKVTHEGDDKNFTVSGLVQVISTGKISNISAAMYESKIGTTTICNYTTLKAAVDSGAKDITVTGTVYVFETLTVPAGVTVKNNGTIVVGSDDSTDVSLTFADEASVKYGIVEVMGTLVFDNKKDNKANEIRSDVSVIGDVSAKYTNLYTALSEAQAGDTVTITRDETVEIKKNLTIKDGVTLDVPNSKRIKIADGVTLTVAGTLKTAEDVKAQTAFAEKASVRERTSAIVVTGTFMSMAAVEYSDYVIAGAYYSLTDSVGAYNYVTTVENASKSIAVSVSVYGKVTAGDIVFTGTDAAPKTVTVQADANLAVSSITLDKTTFIVSGKFSGDVKAGDSAVSAKYVKGMTVSVDSNGLFTVSDVDSNADSTTGERASFKISAGSVYMVASQMAVTVSSGATMVSADDGTDINGKLTIEGMVSVSNKQTITVNNDVVVKGALVVADATDSKDAGTFEARNLYVGLTSNDIGDAASVSGAVDVSKAAYVKADASVSEATIESFKVGGVLKSTTYVVEGKDWMTVYDCTADNSTVIGDVTEAPVKDAKFDGKWLNTDGKNANSSMIGASKCDKVTADVKYDIYTIYVNPAAGIESIAVDGNLMIKDSALGLYMMVVKAGAHEITCKLANGYSGEPKFSFVKSEATDVDGEFNASVSGNKVTVSGDEGTVLVQITGIEKSGYVDPSPDMPAAEKDDGLTITDYLLIVLVVLIVIMAVIVAMRLMRS